MISLTGVTKSYGTKHAVVHALKGLDLTIESGEFVSIMGPSGSGKSTLLNLISALDTPTSGTIRIQGQDISKLDDDALTDFRRCKLGLVFQAFNLLPTLDVIDNVLLPLALERRVTVEDRRRAFYLIRDVGLEKRAQHHVYELSGGEMQRVAIARSLIFEPGLILADEPTGNLDSATGASILDLLRRRCDQQGTTIVMVTHDTAAAGVADRVVSLRDGCVVADTRWADAHERLPHLHPLDAEGTLQ